MTRIYGRENLSDVTGTTHRAFRDVIAKRVLKERFDRTENQHSHLFSTTLMMVSRLRNVKYLGLIRESVNGLPEIVRAAGFIRKKIWGGMTDLATRVVVAKGA